MINEDALLSRIDSGCRLSANEIAYIISSLNQVEVRLVARERLFVRYESIVQIGERFFAIQWNKGSYTDVPDSFSCQLPVEMVEVKTTKIINTWQPMSFKAINEDKILNKIDKGMKLSEREIESIVFNCKRFIDSIEYETWWCNGMKSIIKIGERFFGIYWEQGLTADTANTFWEQLPVEVNEQPKAIK